MNRMWMGRLAGAAALALAACAATPRAAGAQTWRVATWSDAASSDAGDAGLRAWSGGSSVLRLSDAARQPAPVPTRRGPIIRRMRPGTVSLGFQGQYGGIRGSSRLADGFDHGPGYAFRFRYMLSPSSALGFSFEHQRFGSIQPRLNVPGGFADSHVVVTTIAVESVFYRHRENEAHPYFLLGFGYASPDIVFADEVASRVNEGAFLTGGIGLERFVRPRLSIDFSARVYGSIANSEFTSIGEASLGIHLYPGD